MQLTFGIADKITDHFAVMTNHHLSRSVCCAHQPTFSGTFPALGARDKLMPNFGTIAEKSVTNILWVTGRYQLGDDPGLFQDAIYVGHALELPFRKTWIDPNATSIKLIIYTNDVETWGIWQGHRVSINDVEIGRLKDPNDTQGVSERFELTIAKSTFDKALAGNDDFLLTVELETQASQPGLSDDFVLHRIESNQTIAARLGWK